MEKWKETLKKTSNWFWAMLPFFVGFRMYINLEAAAWEGYQFPFTSLFPGFLQDIVLCFSSWILFGTLSLFFRKKANWFAAFIAFHILFLNIVLDQYFLVSREPLDEAVFLFTWKEIWMIAGIEQRLNAPTIAALVGVFSLFCVFAFWMGKLKSKLNRRWMNVLITLGLVSLISFPFICYENEDNQALEALRNNRLVFFTTKSASYLLAPKKQFEEIYQVDFKELEPAFYGRQRQNTSLFPMWKAVNEKSALAPFFKKTSDGKPPHIVVIICESMSSDMYGERGKRTGIIMPFMDSLSKQSLYFPNTFSTSQRTHNVLPAVLCSVPNVVDGIAFQQIQYPNHWSLMSLLKKDYYSRFYCGVPLEYLSMRGFMNYHNVDYLVDHWSEEQIQHSKEVNSPWGFPDEDLFKQAFEDDKTQNLSQKRRLDIFLTISSHDPFIYPEKEKYTASVIQSADSIKDEKERKLIISQAGGFGAFRYVDDQLRAFFEVWKTKADYENTIFIITGDHGTELYNANPMAKYNVPLVIYSPLLKKPYHSKAVVSHTDITPSLLNLLQTKYKVALPDSTPFVGKELVFSDQFFTKRTLVYTTNKLRTSDVFKDDTIMLSNQLYTVSPDFKLHPIQAENRKKWLKQQLHLYQYFSQYTLLQNKLIPQKAQEKWVGSEVWHLEKEKAVSLKGKSLRARMLYVGAYALQPKKVKKFRVQLSAELYCKRKRDLSKTGDLLLNLKKTIWLSKNWTLFKAIRPSFVEKFKPRNWNKILYTLEFTPRQIKALRKPENVYFYVHNPSLYDQALRNLVVKFEVVK